MSFRQDWNDIMAGAGQMATYYAKKVGMTDDDLGYIKYLAGSVPYVRDVVNASEGNQKALSYMENRGLSWSNVLYATNLPGYGSGSGLVSNGYNFVSRNIGRLYR